MVYERLMEMTGGRGPDRCIDAVGGEAHASGSMDAVVDKAKAAMFLGTDRPHVLREAIMCCRKGGTLSVPGVYIGLVDKIPFGAAMNKGLTIKMGQTHIAALYRAVAPEDRIGRDRPVICGDAPRQPRRRAENRDVQDLPDKQDGCIKVVMTPNIVRQGS